jgi:hypothetical protein
MPSRPAAASAQPQLGRRSCKHWRRSTVACDERGSIVIIFLLLSRIRWIAIALLVTTVGTARAEQRVWPPQVVDGYTVTLSMAAQPAPPGDNEVVVTIRDAAGRPVTDAEVSIALLAYIRAVSTNPNTTSTPNQHVHTPGASAAEGQELIPVPVRLAARTEVGTYRGARISGIAPI